MSPLVALNPSGEHILLALEWLVNVGLGWQLLLLLLPFDRFLPGGLHHQILYAASSMPAHRGGEEGARGVGGCLEESYESADSLKAKLAGHQRQPCLASTGPLRQYLGRGVRATSGVWK